MNPASQRSDTGRWDGGTARIRPGRRGGIKFVIAATPEDKQQIRSLNYRTFVEEIPQHTPNGERELLDRFDSENEYILAKDGDRVVGMIAVRGRRPFSLDSKLDDLDSHLPPGHRPCEIRLLAVEREYRSGFVFRGLMHGVEEVFRERHYTLALISGSTRQLKLYRHLGFVPFAHPVGTQEAMYQPMYLAYDSYLARVERFGSGPEGRLRRINFLPGPTAIHPEVQRAFAEEARSHRGQGFRIELDHARRLIADLTGASDCQVLLGSGTAANDVVAAQLRSLRMPGLVISTGEFGDRLIDHASRMQLLFQAVRLGWGASLGAEQVVTLLDQAPEARWIWLVHCETSTGALNDLSGIAAACTERGIRLAADCVSSIGCVPLDLRDVFLASASSGKGLGSFPGLGIVLHNGTAPTQGDPVPRSLDLSLYERSDSIPFTHSSNLVRALRVALERTSWSSRHAMTALDGARARKAAGSYALRTVMDSEATSPAVLTFGLPAGADSVKIGDALERGGVMLSYRSAYLVERNWIQLCLMGDYPSEDVTAVVDQLAQLVAESVQDAGTTTTVTERGA